MRIKIPSYLQQWFKQQHWTMHPYQEKMFKQFSEGRSTLLIAPTGGGKTLAGFLPSLVDIHQQKIKHLHTLYISPLKALTSDIARNLTRPIAEMGLKVTVNIRTGDTSSYWRKKQWQHPPHILLTTPESLMLLLSYPHSCQYFSHLKVVIIDELHHLIKDKRGDMVALALARLREAAPSMLRIGLSATISDSKPFATWLSANKEPVTVIRVNSNVKPTLNLLTPVKESIPYSGYMAGYAVSTIYQTISQYQMSLIFVNTRAQAEFLFRQLWEINQSQFPLAIYHGSLSKTHRQKIENYVALRKLRAIVTTSALELGIDWGDIDCVIQVGAPKGTARLLQRIGRSNHQFNKNSLAYLVPNNCFETLECSAAITAINQGQIDNDEIKLGALDVVIQFIMNCACSGPLNRDKLYQEILGAYPYRTLAKNVYDQLFQFVIDGGYTLHHYAQYHRLLKNKEGNYQASTLQVVRRHRQNIGTIVEATHLRVKLIYKRRTKIIGEIEESFAQQLVPGDTFLFAGQVLKFITIRDMFLEAEKTTQKAAKLPSFLGGNLPLSTYLANAVQQLIYTPQKWNTLPPRIHEWLSLQKKFSALPMKDKLLVELFPYKKEFVLAIYTFAGRTANNTLAMLLSQRMESLLLAPLTLTASDYGIAIHSLKPLTKAHVKQLLTTDLLDQDLNAWLQKSPILKRAFRKIAIISGLTQRKIAGTKKSIRQLTFSTDLLYDVLMRYEPEHILLKITREEVEKQLLDLSRLKTLLTSFEDKLLITNLTHPSPFSIPLITSFDTEKILGTGAEELLSHLEKEAKAKALIDEVRQRVK